MSGAHRPAVAVAHAGRFPGENASPWYVQSARFVDRRIGSRRGVVSPAFSGSLVPNAYQAPSLPRTTAGSANVSAAGADTGLRGFTGFATACCAGTNRPAAINVTARSLLIGAPQGMGCGADVGPCTT